MDTEAIDLLTPEQLAELTKVPVKTLEQWRSRKQGPRFVRLGRLVRYRITDVEEWIEEGWPRPG